MKDRRILSSWVLLFALAATLPGSAKRPASCRRATPTPPSKTVRYKSAAFVVGSGMRPPFGRRKRQAGNNAE